MSAHAESVPVPAKFGRYEGSVTTMPATPGVDEAIAQAAPPALVSSVAVTFALAIGADSGSEPSSGHSRIIAKTLALADVYHT